VTVNKELKNQLLARNYDCIVKNAFIPPLLENEPALPKEIFNWLTINKKEGNLIICANASHLETYNNQDLYGLDLCIEVTKRLVSQNLPVKFLFVVGANNRDKSKFLKNLAIIKQLNLSDHFFLISKRLSFVKVIELCDIVLRPTNTDGDALTVREALFLGKMVLASDVVKRPTNVFLFENRHIEDLENQLKKLIKSLPTQYKSKGQRYIESSENVKAFYLELLETTLRKELADNNPEHTKELV
jgi:glycosyltransferase involved in cell wall biosynthesis